MSPRSSFLAILLLALAARLAAGVWWQGRLEPGTKFAFGDSESYWQLGRSLAEGKPYRYGAENGAIFRTPGFPLLLAPLFLIFGPEPPVMAARAICAVLGTASVAAVMGLARTLFDDRVALLAGLATAIDPGAITLGVFVLSEAPFAPLMVLNIWAWALAWQARDRRTMLLHAAWGGIAAGLATLMRPSWLLFVPFAAGVGCVYLLVWQFLSARRASEGRGSQQPAGDLANDPLGDSGQNSRRFAAMLVPRWRVGLGMHFAIVGAMFITLSLTMLPWWIRNYTITGHFIPTTLQVGASLYDGLGPQADGSSDMRFVPIMIAEQEFDDAVAAEPPTDTFEERVDRRMREASLAWAKAHPSEVARLAGVKFLRLWSPWPNASELGGFLSKLAIAVGYLPLIGLGLAGVWKYGRQDWSFALLAVPAVYLTLLHMVFVSSLRYRQPAMLLIAILASAIAIETWNTFSRARSRRAEVSA